MLRRFRPWLIGAVVACAAVAAGFWFGLHQRQAPVDPDSQSALERARFQNTTGETRKLADLAGRPALLNFWATWCAPCLAELPLLDRTHRERGRDLQIIGIAVDSPEAVHRFQSKVPLALDVWIADANALDLLPKLGNRAGGLPFSVLVDGQGRVLNRHLGALTEASLPAFLAPALPPPK